MLNELSYLWFFPVCWFFLDLFPLIFLLGKLENRYGVSSFFVCIFYSRNTSMALTNSLHFYTCPFLLLHCNMEEDNCIVGIVVLVTFICIEWDFLWTFWSYKAAWLEPKHHLCFCWSRTKLFICICRHCNYTHFHIICCSFMISKSFSSFCLDLMTFFAPHTDECFLFNCIWLIVKYFLGIFLHDRSNRELSLCQVSF